LKLKISKPYFILAFLMAYLYSTTNTGDKSWVKGIKLGVIIGVVWVFPHGLVMAATHDTSLVHEIKNTLYHIVEQGIGGTVVFYVFSCFKPGKELNRMNAK
jgi:hypothetical protein